MGVSETHGDDHSAATAITTVRTRGRHSLRATCMSVTGGGGAEGQLGAVPRAGRQQLWQGSLLGAPGGPGAEADLTPRGEQEAL